MGCSGCLGLLLVGVLSVPCVGLLALFGPTMWNDYWNAGSATGPAAVERAAKFVGEIDGGRWKSVATNVTAKWTAGDWSGDQIDDVSFTLPPDELARFERAVAKAAGPPERDESASGGWVAYGVGWNHVRFHVRRSDGTISFGHLHGTIHETNAGK